MTAKLPADYENRMKDMLGDRFGDYMEALKCPPVKALRLNMLRVPSVDIARVSRISCASDDPEPVSWQENAFYYESDVPGKSPLFEAGAYYIQEPSAMIPVTMLGVDDGGMKVLDLCAAPGGKTTQIADRMKGKGLLVANEIVGQRAQILSENTERLGVANALVCSHEPSFLADRFPAFFDRILVDAPCSGEGMFRKNPEAMDQWSEENVKMCASRQADILDNAAKMLSPGGMMVYSTCTFSYDEDEGAVNGFLSRHPEFEITDGPKRVYPFDVKGEGHFAVSLKKAGEACPSENPRVLGKKQVLSKAEDALLSDFCEAVLKDDCPLKEMINDRSRIVRFGSSIYLAPDHMCDISSMKVLRSGVKLGTFLKNRFEPDHALSHVLGPEDVRCYVNYFWDSQEAKDFINGMTLSCDASIKGWCIVCVENIALGWGKASGGVIKNHYPKGLRKRL